MTMLRGDTALPAKCGRRWASATALCSAVAVLSSCDGDRSALPTAIQPPDDVSRVSVCQECDLIVDTRPLAASISRSDSAGHFINLAKFRVRGEPGDRVTLTLTAAEDVFSVLGLDQRLLVDVGGDRTEFTFQELAAGATVHVFRESGEIYIQYMLNRHVSTRPEGAVQLTQSVAGAQVVEAATPWVLAEARRPVLLSSLTTAASCPVPAPGTHCGVTVGIDPFVTGGALGGFQSDEGTGASSTIVVTFSPAVSSVTVTALDPDFGGNRMVARSPATGEPWQRRP